MKKTVILLLAIFLFGGIITSQIAFPGGVSGPAIWLSSEKNQTGEITWESRLSALRNGYHFENLGSKDENYLNFNPALFLNGFQQELRIDLEDAKFPEATIFTVYQPKDAYWEKSLWYYEIDGTNRLILTTHRVADLERLNYMNFSPQRIDLPIIHTYSFQRKDKDEAPLQQYLRFARMPEKGNLPITSFEGIIPEFIAFDRVLTPDERMRVETYLSLKYGISVSQFGTTFLLDAENRVIWNGKECEDFPYYITGIGRDDASGLDQKQSASSYNPSLLAIGANRIASNNPENKAVMPDKSYLIWGDNGESLLFEKEAQGHPERLSRKWLVTASGEINQVKTEVRLGVKQLKKPANPGETYWLVIDRSGTGKFPAGAVEYFKAVKTTSDEFIFFQNIEWDPDRSGKDLFTIAIGPEMIAETWITPPQCNPRENGRIQVGAAGGQPPYRFSLINLADQSERNWVTFSSDLEEVMDVAQGDYRLKITDAQGHKYEEALYVQSADAPLSDLKNSYLLKPGQPLRLDAARGITASSVSYCWIGPDGSKSYSPEITVSTPGSYQLILNREGCESRQNIRITQQGEDPFKDLALFPNPVSSDGTFNLKIALSQPAPVEVFMYDSSGRLVQNRSSGSARDHFLSGKINAPGNYVLKLISMGFTRSLTLTVE